MSQNGIRQGDGVTLIELAIVLAIVAVVAVIAIPAYISMLPHMDLKNAAGEVGGEILQARMRSISEGKDYTVSFDHVNDTYTVTPEGGTAVGPGNFPWKRVDIYDDGSDPLVSSFSGDDVTFRPNGTAATAGYEAVYFKNNPVTNERYRVKVLGVTGKVKVERWMGGSWQNAF